MAGTPSTIRATTQGHLDIEDIIDDVVILKDGSGCLILQANSINFDLLSDMEQEATIYAYAAILNSLTYPIQIMIHSERKDVSDYLKLIKMYEDRQTSKLLKEQIRKYRRFVEETVERNNVLDKRFYIVIPFSNVELGASKSMMGLGGGKKGLPFDKNYIIQEAKNHLIPKKDHLMRQFTRLGIRLRQLTTPELIELFYKIYNPDAVGQKLAPTQAYTAPMVQGPAHITEKLVQKVSEFNSVTLPQPKQAVSVSAPAVKESVVSTTGTSPMRQGELLTKKPLTDVPAPPSRLSPEGSPVQVQPRETVPVAQGQPLTSNMVSGNQAILNPGPTVSQTSQ